MRCADGEGVSLGRGEVGECADGLREKAQQLLQAQRLLAYLNWLLKIIELRYIILYYYNRGK